MFHKYLMVSAGAIALAGPTLAADLPVQPAVQRLLPPVIMTPEPVPLSARPAPR